MRCMEAINTGPLMDSENTVQLAQHAEQASLEYGSSDEYDCAASS